VVSKQQHQERQSIELRLSGINEINCWFSFELLVRICDQTDVKTILLAHALPGLVLGALAVRLCAQDVDLPTIIVAPMQGDMSQIQGWQPALGEGLAEMLVTEISKINKFQVLESTQLGTLIDEVKLGEEGYVNQAEKVDKGGFSAADFMFVGKVTRFGNKTTGVNLGGFVPKNLGNLGVRQTVSDVRIDWRVTDVANRRVLKTGSSVANEKGLGFEVGANIQGSGGHIGFDNQEFMNSALGKATVKALSNIVTDLKAFQVPASSRARQKAAAADRQKLDDISAATALRRSAGKVIKVAGNDAVFISLGKKNGLNAGSKLKLYEVTEIKDDQGKVIFSDEKLVGELVVTAVQEEGSKASYDGDAQVKPGWVVKSQ
jgi:curli biogenesis system outer membrane secretion channel CsgG